MKWVVIGSLAIVAVITAATPHMNLLGALLILVFGFYFCDSFITTDWSNWTIIESNLWYDGLRPCFSLV